MITYRRTLRRSQLDNYFCLVLQSSYPLHELKIHINSIYITVCLCSYIQMGCFYFRNIFLKILVV
jgi:hypothetical protein